MLLAMPMAPCLWYRHTSRFLVIWLGLMPLTLWKACHWAMIPASAIIAFLLLGIEEIGVQIEEPFGILPLGKQSSSAGLSSRLAFQFCPSSALCV